MKYETARYAGNSLPALLAMGVSVLALSMPATVFAQSSPTLQNPGTTAEQGAEGDSEPAAREADIVVTGSRLQNGFKAPSPLTTVTAEQLTLAAPNNLADGLNMLPQVNYSSRPNNPNTNVGSVGPGQNTLSLRGLNANRTLILLDGRRLVGSNTDGSVDVNTIPQALVKSVEIVTGGASATYGSDAVAGVVNFTLNTKFEGLTASASAGISTRGDLPASHLKFAGGFSAMDGRLHFIAGGEAYRQDGIEPTETTGRDWFDRAAGLISITGAPGRIYIPDIRSSLGTYGGLITNGPLAGNEFTASGTLTPHDFGTRYTALGNAAQNSGGTGPRMNVGFSPEQTRANIFAHAEFEASDNLTVFAEGAFAYTRVDQGAFVDMHTGTANQFTIFNDNAYLSPTVLGQMAAAGVTSFTMGRYDLDFPSVRIVGDNKTYRTAGGVKGSFGNDGRWKWDASYSWGRTNIYLAQENLVNNRNLYAAADAVRAPNGSIVCRSTLSGLDPGCVPANFFGSGNINPAAINYIIGNSWKRPILTQQVAQVNLAGDLGEKFSLGAGPISVATGVEYRNERVVQTTDPLSPLTTSTVGLRGAPSAQSNRVGSFNFHNPIPFSGEYNIKEAYFEAGLPVFRDRPFARELTLNGAVRYADYSTSGGVTTWRVGGIWQIVDDIRLRATRSRDIRSPNVFELFNTAVQGNSTITYQGVINRPLLVISRGNPNLTPEFGSTLTYGVVLTPTFLPGFSLSVDRYQIEIKDVIAGLNQQQIVDFCAAGNQLACSQISISAGGLLTIFTQNLNLNRTQVRGIDFEAAYNTRAGDNLLGFRLVASHMERYKTFVPGGTVIDRLGDTALPKWRGAAQVTLTTPSGWTFFAQEQFQGAALIDTTRVSGVTIFDNHVPSFFYTDVSVTYQFKGKSAPQAFFTVNNLFDRDPPIAPQLSSFSKPTSDAYDHIGRFFTFGIRMKM